MTSLRRAPGDAEVYTGKSVYNGEVVEVLSSESGGCLRVRTALCGADGWLKAVYLQDCPEGTCDHGRLVGDGRRGPTRIELSPNGERFQEVQAYINQSICTNPKCCCYGHPIVAKRIWFVAGQYLGEMG